MIIYIILPGLAILCVEVPILLLCIVRAGGIMAFISSIIFFSPKDGIFASKEGYNFGIPSAPIKDKTLDNIIFDKRREEKDRARDGI
ncbi:uncharacterized protein BO95DRAFT_223039 [Aspergillus brunneoviolaceus CBS 621.78]|uniref:Uncharacterized protein n=1 Tax=Aspergillus brunneoviolaceus CBS 621.78 TaxID=1450534 RepID=A0ACD1GLC2_9EURO|nr:hypothetical protein BO95DRAFT_223039 [Aspergillus brunneoviolaceus CBS 621.78]RAH50144.1 hypothetical protein BO95DRAFT_223039 [Aspergillus brunneoviolaceus CBS 621.78]